MPVVEFQPAAYLQVGSVDQLFSHHPEKNSYHCYVTCYFHLILQPGLDLEDMETSCVAFLLYQ